MYGEVLILDNRNLAHEPLVQAQNSKIDLHYCLASMDHGSRVLQRWLALAPA